MRKYFFVFLFILLASPSVSLAAEPFDSEPALDIQTETFQAKVLQILKEESVKTESGAAIIQQNVELLGLTGGWRDKTFVVNGIGNLEVVGNNEVRKGQKVVVSYTKDMEGNDLFMITDQVRLGAIYWLTALFIAILLIIGRKEGLKAIINLIFTFLVIMWLVVPAIARGGSPLFYSLLGSLIILFVIVYFTWGINKKSHLATVSIFLALFITGIISLVFTRLASLSGLADDNVLFLVGIPGAAIHFDGLLLAGIILGALGVLDDVVMSQISIVEQLVDLKNKMSRGELFRRAMRIGVDHISSMTNTLFLAYAGAALPLLLLFSVRTDSSVTVAMAINNQMIATELVRTLAGSIGLILAVPLATLLAVAYLPKLENNK